MKKHLLDNRSLMRAGIAGAGLGILGIFLFVGMWALLGTLGINSLVRMILSVCLPPFVIGGIVAIYAVANQSGLTS